MMPMGNVVVAFGGLSVGEWVGLMVLEPPPVSVMVGGGIKLALASRIWLVVAFMVMVTSATLVVVSWSKLPVGKRRPVKVPTLVVYHSGIDSDAVKVVSTDCVCSAPPDLVGA